MSELRITMSLDNDAFQGEDFGPEIKGVLEELLDRIGSTHRDEYSGLIANFNIRDGNGNRIGLCQLDLSDDEEDDDDS